MWLWRCMKLYRYRDCGINQVTWFQTLQTFLVQTYRHATYFDRSICESAIWGGWEGAMFKAVPSPSADCKTVCKWRSLDKLYLGHPCLFALWTGLRIDLPGFLGSCSTSCLVYITQWVIYGVQRTRTRAKETSRYKKDHLHLKATRCQ